MQKWGGVVNFSWWDAAELVTFLFGDTVELVTFLFGDTVEFATFLSKVAGEVDLGII